MKLRAIHHVRFAVGDLDRTERFAADFGLMTVERTDARLVMRTQGGDAFAYIAEQAAQPKFIGVGIEVESVADLDEAVARFGATARRALDTPGGGEAVTLVDPDGLQIDLLADVARLDGDGVESPDLRHNSPRDRVRYDDSQHTRTLGPPQLYRLGHVGIFVADFAATSAWYERTLGLIGSEIYHVPHDPGHRIVGFFRLDRGAEYVDHHTIALMQREQADCHHISFEAQDFEAQFVAHRWLKTKGYEAIWGVGRHPHGSHVFDVWRDPDGWRFETFSDTDLLKADRPTRVHDVSTVQMDIWSDDPPDRYFA